MKRAEAPLDLKGLVFAFFLSAGHFKGDPRLSWLPVDLTLLLGLGTAGLMAAAFYRDGFRLPRALFWVLLLFTVLAVPLLWTEWHAYANEKVSRFFTLTLLAAVAPLFLFRTTGDLWRFFGALAIPSLILGYDALKSLLLGGSGAMRLTAFGSNPIAFGRSLGLLFLWVAVLAVERRLKPIIALPLAGAAGLLLVASGSRGPLLGAIACLAAAGVICYRKDPLLLLRLTVAGATAGAVLLAGLQAAPKESGDRITRLTQGELGGSELARIDAYQQSWRLIQEHPEGLGWGSFANQVDQSGNGGADRQYPHNLMLEVLLEGGWISGLAVLLMMLAALRRMAALPPATETRNLLVIFLFFLVNAQVSGDLNDNRLLFALAATGLQTGWERLEGGAPDLGPRPPGYAHLPQGVPEPGGGRTPGGADRPA